MTAETSSVSIVLATYNGETFLPLQLDSLARQSVAPFELIISDDDSTDGTRAVVEQFSERATFPIIQLHNRTRLGYGANFLSACTVATGTYIAFCDQDDVWETDKLSRAVKALESTGADLYIHTATAIDDAGRHIGHFTQGISKTRVQPPLSLNPWTAYYGFSMIFRRELLDLIAADQRGRHLFEHDTPLSHDLWVYFLAFSLGSVYLDRKPLAQYRQHAANETPHVIGGGFRSWTSKLGRSVDPKLSREEIAVDRVALMKELSRNNQGVKALKAKAAANYWTRIASIEAERIALYSARPLRRPTKMARLIAKRAYSPSERGGLESRLLVKDCLAGMCGIRRRP